MPDLCVCDIIIIIIQYIYLCFFSCLNQLYMPKVTVMLSGWQFEIPLKYYIFIVVICWTNSQLVRVDCSPIILNQ